LDVKTAYKFSGCHDGNVSASFKVPVNKYVSIKPYVQYSFPLTSNADKEIKSFSFDGKSSKFLYGGISFDLAF
jgi:hypothetical protein